MGAGEDYQPENYLRRSRPRLLRAARLASGSWADAEDLLHEAYLRTTNKLAGLASDGERDAYIMRSLYRLQMRRSRRFWNREVPGPMEDTPAHDGDMDTAMHVRTALLALPARQRMTLICRYYLDLSVQQTATAMNCEPGTVKSQTAHGLERLRERLQGDSL
jgi:RNA polymerase sigma factor (sigma-70 family)